MKTKGNFPGCRPKRLKAQRISPGGPTSTGSAFQKERTEKVERMELAHMKISQSWRETQVSSLKRSQRDVKRTILRYTIMDYQKTRDTQKFLQVPRDQRWINKQRKQYDIPLKEWESDWHQTSHQQQWMFKDNGTMPLSFWRKWFVT